MGNLTTYYSRPRCGGAQTACPRARHSASLARGLARVQFLVLSILFVCFFFLNSSL